MTPVEFSDEETAAFREIQAFKTACILVPRASVSFGHVVGETEG